MESTAYHLLADLVLIVHLMLAIFVILGLLLILIGGAAGWAWVRNLKFRVLHLAAIGVIALQAWLGMICPLTLLESALRVRAGEEPYAGTFVSHWLQELLYYDFPLWVFAVAYSLFAGLVILAWWWVPPIRKPKDI